MNLIKHKLCCCLLIVLTVPLIHYGQRTEYKEAFAPAGMWVQQAEKPYRDDICLNGLWQFQPLPWRRDLKKDMIPHLLLVKWIPVDGLQRLSAFLHPGT